MSSVRAEGAVGTERGLFKSIKKKVFPKWTKCDLRITRNSRLAGSNSPGDGTV